MLKEYRFEKFVNVVAGKCNSITDTKTYYRVNEHWVNAIVLDLLYDRAIARGYKNVEDSNKRIVHEDCKYYRVTEFEIRKVLSKKGI